MNRLRRGHRARCVNGIGQDCTRGKVEEAERY